jgi:hypothetical protein
MGTRLLVAVCAGLLLAGCLPTDPSDVDVLRNNRALWDATRPATYEYVLQRGSCECTPESMVPMRITVEGRQLRSVTHAGTGAPIDTEANQVRSVDDLFDLIANAHRQGAHLITVAYDRTLGYPNAIFIDYSRQVVDDEMTLNARELRAVQ